MGRRTFTVAEVNAQVPRLQAAFGAVMQLRARLRTLYQKLAAAGHAPSGDDFPVEVPGAPLDVLRDRATFKALVETLREELAAVQALGCVIKDVEIGLVDWPAEHDGREVLLCWRYGEREVAFWHELDTGYAGRRPVSELQAPPPRPRTLH
jgi:hypothetical protein